MISNRLSWLLHPKTIIISIVSGITVGIWFKPLAQDLAPFGAMYMDLLQMCIIPLLITAIASSLGSLIVSGEAKNHLKKIVIFFSFGLLLSAGVGLGIGVLGQIGANLSLASKQAIGNLVQDSTAVHLSSSSQPSLLGFFQQMVPKNIFVAFTQGHNLAILFFAILFGVSLGLGTSSSGRIALQAMEGLYDSFLRMINGVMYGLPIGLFCLFSDHVSKLGIEIFSALTSWVVFTYVASIVIILCSFFFIWRTTRVPIRSLLQALKKPSIVALATSSSFATIPSAIEALEVRLKLDRQMTHLILPLGVCLNPTGSALMNGLTVIFMMNLYDVSMTPVSLAVALIGSVFAAIAMSGTPGVGSLAMLSIVLSPLGLPLETAIILSIATLPITEPAVTLANVSGNLAISSFLAKKAKTSIQHPISAPAPERLPVDLDISPRTPKPHLAQ